MASETSVTSPLTAVEKALRDSLLVPAFRDVYLYAFSRRTILPDGILRIDHPLPVVAISSILKNTECFSKLLAAPRTVQQCASESSEYDYESDSDLDESEELQAGDLDGCPVGPGPSSAGGSSYGGRLKVRETDLENDDDVVKTSNIVAMKKHIEVSVPNVAYRTLRACVFYLYTGKINFLPFTSSGPTERQIIMFSTSNDLAPPCSPKSAYRLAELYGLTDLQELAYNKIVSQLNPENILEEIFSSFFVRYDRLRKHVISYLSQNYYKPAVQQSLPDAIQRMALGEMPHAGGVLRSLLGLPVATSLPTMRHLVSLSRGIRLSHPRTSKPMPHSPSAINQQPIFKPDVLSQPVVFGASSPIIAPSPLPPTEPPSATASAYNPSSSSIGPAAAPRDSFHEEALMFASEARSAEMTAVDAGTAEYEGSGEPSVIRAPVNVAQLTTAPDARPFDQSAPVDETPVGSLVTRKKKGGKAKKYSRKGTLTDQVTSTTSGLPTPPSAPRLSSSAQYIRPSPPSNSPPPNSPRIPLARYVRALGDIWPSGYGPDRGPEDADEGSLVLMNTMPEPPELVTTFPHEPPDNYFVFNS